MFANTSALLGALYLGLLAWLYYDVSSIKIDYALSSYLVNATTGAKMRPIELVDLNEIIRPSEEHIARANPTQRLYQAARQLGFLDIFAPSRTYSNSRELESAAWPVADPARCGQQLNWLLDKLATTGQRRGRASLLEGRLGEELTQLVDSFGRPAAGLYSGTLTWPGQYEQCKGLTLNAGQIKTRYCLALARLKQWPSQLDSGPPRSLLKLGLCIPETCETRSYESQGDKIHRLLGFGLDEFTRDNIQLHSLFCPPDLRSPSMQLSLGARIFIATLGLWLTSVALASIWVHLSRSATCEEIEGRKWTGSRAAQLARALSVQHSWAKFTANPLEEKRAQAERENKPLRVHLGPINFCKCLMAVLVLVCHSYMFAILYATSLARRLELSLSRVFHAGAGLGQTVDTFFLLFGLLAGYNAPRKYPLERLASPLTWLRIYLNIMARNLPLYLLLYFFAKTLELHLGEGPWWDYGTYRYSVRGHCMREPWWRALPHFSRTGEQPRSSCLPSGWFLTCLAQISLILPLLIFLLYKLPSHLKRHLFLASLAFISFVQIAIKMKRQSSFKGDIFGTHGALLTIMLELWENTGTMDSLGRLSTVAYGCYLGLLLHLYETGAIREWPRWLTRKGTLLCVSAAHLVILAMPLAGNIFISRTGHTTTINEFLGSHLLNLVTWPMLNGVLILTSATTYNGTRLCRALSRPFWHTANKLGPCLYLVHWSVLVYLVSGYPGAPSQGYTADALKLAALALAISLGLSFLLVLLFDTPLSTLIALITDERSKPRAPAAATTTGGQKLKSLVKSKLS